MKLSCAYEHQIKQAEEATAVIKKIRRTLAKQRLFNKINGKCVLGCVAL